MKFYMIKPSQIGLAISCINNTTKVDSNENTNINFSKNISDSHNKPANPGEKPEKNRNRAGNIQRTGYRH